MTKTKRKRGRKAAPLNAKRPGRTAPGPMTPTGGNHREATDTAQRIERRKQVWNLYVFNRWSMQQIATHLSANGLPCTPGTVANDIHAVAAESKHETEATLRHGVDMELQRLDQLDRALLPVAMGNIDPDRITTFKGRGKKRKATTVQVPLKAEPRTRLQMDALEKLRRNSESRRKLLGTDRQPDAGVVALEQVVTAVRGLIGDVLALALEPQARKSIADAIGKRFGVIEGEVTERS